MTIDELKKMEGVVFRTGASKRHLSIKAEDLRTGKRRRLPDRNFLIRIPTRRPGAGLQQAAAEATAAYDALARQIWVYDATGQRTVIRINLPQKEACDLMALKVAVG